MNIVEIIKIYTVLYTVLLKSHNKEFHHHLVILLRVQYSIIEPLKTLNFMRNAFGT